MALRSFCNAVAEENFLCQKTQTCLFFFQIEFVHFIVRFRLNASHAHHGGCSLRTSISQGERA